MQLNITNSTSSKLLKAELSRMSAELGVNISTLTTILLSYAMSHVEEAAKEYFRPQSPPNRVPPPNAFARVAARGLRPAQEQLVLDVKPKSEAVSAMFEAIAAKP